MWQILQGPKLGAISIENLIIFLQLVLRLEPEDNPKEEKKHCKSNKSFTE
jgi:hypothetical protein